jgi:hypothetical protein
MAINSTVRNIVDQEEFDEMDLKAFSREAQKISLILKLCPTYILDIICRNEEIYAAKEIQEEHKTRFRKIIEHKQVYENLEKDSETIESEFRKTRKSGRKYLYFCKNCGIKAKCPYLN